MKRNTHFQGTDREQLGRMIAWYSKTVLTKLGKTPAPETAVQGRVALLPPILRAYISPCKNCSICEYDCERILDLSIPVIEANNIRGPCIPVDLTKFEKEFFDYE